MAAQWSRRRERSYKLNLPNRPGLERTWSMPFGGDLPHTAALTLKSRHASQFAIPKFDRP